MKKYECILLFVPDITEKKLDKCIEELKTMAKITKPEKKGIQRLACTIRQPSTRIRYYTANYFTCYMTGESEEIESISKSLEKNVDVIKATIVRTGGK